MYSSSEHYSAFVITEFYLSLSVNSLSLWSQPCLTWLQTCLIAMVETELKWMSLNNSRWSSSTCHDVKLNERSPIVLTAVRFWQWWRIAECSVLLLHLISKICATQHQGKSMFPAILLFKQFQNHFWLLQGNKRQVSFHVSWWDQSLKPEDFFFNS